MPREGGASSTPRLIDSIIGVSGILGHPLQCAIAHKAGDDDECAFAISRRIAPEVCKFVGPLERQRAQGRPGARCTRGLACNCARERAHEHTGSAETLRPSLRNGFTAYFVLSPVNGFFATVAAQNALDRSCART